MSVRYSLLSRTAIFSCLQAKEIVIDPFRPENVGTNSYDVTLGEYYWREQNGDSAGLPALRVAEYLYNPYDEDHVQKLWNLERAQPAERVLASQLGRGLLKNIRPKDQVILIRPQEAILAHTLEFIGGCSNDVTTMMKARSSAGRNFLEVARCAGLGDISYCNRWTLEVTNNSRFNTIPLVVGRRIGQVVFFKTDPLEETDPGYISKGKYQSATIEETKANWKPEDMLPKMYLDWEVTEGQEAGDE